MTGRTAWGAASEKTLEKAVREVLAALFPDADIDRIVARPDLDHDGGEILRVFVVLNGGRDQLDLDNRVGLVRHLRSKLEPMGVEAFPLVRFIEKHDIDRFKRELA